MVNQYYQCTLKSRFTLGGKGLHTGLRMQITFNPAPEDHGYKIRRVDMAGQPVIDALAENVTGTARRDVGKLGYIVNKPLLYPNEPARPQDQ